jgi:hypothetical protein
MRAINEMALVSIFSGLLVGLAVAVPAYYIPISPWELSGGVDTTVQFTYSDILPLLNVTGDVHVNMTGSWAASAQTWQAWDYIGYHLSSCYPRCGNSSISGTISYSQDFCTKWPDGTSSYGAARPYQIIFVWFATQPNVNDTVGFQLQWDITGSTVCA